VIAAAGDIACTPSSRSFNNGLGTATQCRQKHTSDLLVNAGLEAVLALGDTQYETGRLPSFLSSYDPSWGRVKPITHPIAGNHEYKTPGAAGYFDYFNGVGAYSGPAGTRDKGYYSFDIGSWHLVALNTNCSIVRCSAGSEQERWLRDDLAAHPNACTLAYWHEPRFSSGGVGSRQSVQPLWKAAYTGGVDLVLSASSHFYERFAPQDGSGKLDSATGVRVFVVGTGGRSLSEFGRIKPNSEVRQNHTYGVLKLTLHPTSYDWQFVPEAGKSFTDAGTSLCHGPPPLGGLGVGGGSRCTIVGTVGNDVLRGTSRRDIICGLGGNDRIRGRGGNDLARGGAGEDQVSGGKGRDRIYGNSGNDVLHGHSGSDRLRGGSGRDRLYGDAGNDLLRGQRGNDRLRAGRGRDRLYGNAGNDRLSALDRRPRDRVNGGTGRDRASVNSGDRVRAVERVSRH
jgi:hypothetical protein